MNKSGKSSIFKASLLVALLGTALGSQAAGLGKLTVYSAIGQPLNAEVSLTATPEELSALSAKLASHAAFSDAGIDFMPALTGLRFSVAKSPGGQPVLRLTTDSPLNEPFLHFLVELNWTAGRMVREYTFLLDPPEMLQVGKPAPYMPAVPPAQGAASKSPPAKAMVPAAAAAPARPATTGTRAAGTASSQTGSAGEYQVKSGDTLGKIARDHKVESVSLDQMLVALFNNNRDVFDANNMNRLRAGKILRLPDSTDVAKVDGGEARKLIVSQAADFNAYRRRLADAAGSAPAVAVAPQQQVAGKIKPQVETKAAPTSGADKLEVSRTEAAKTAKAGGAGKSNLEEDLIARDKSLREAAERIAQLEKNLENLKHLVELKSQPGVQAQQQAQAAASPKPVEEKKPEVPAAKPAEPAPVASVPAAEKPLEPAAPVVAPEPAKPVEPQKAPESPVAPAPVAKKPVPAPSPAPEPSFVEDSPELVFGGGGLLALLLSYLGFTAWRKKKQAVKQADFVDHPSVSESDQAAKSGTVFGAASESVDSGEVSIQGDFSEGGVLTTEENVDPVAEADVLMAYGRDGQAEEILKEGLKSDPTRGAIHLKLLELYANRKSIQQFEAVAKDLHGLNGGRGAEWEKATDLARVLGVTGGLFPGAVAVASVVPVEPEKAPADSLVIKAASEEAAVPEVAPVVQEEAPVAEADVGSLDFDLDLGTTSGPAVAALAEQAAAKPAAEEVMSLDFDFDLGTPEPTGTTAAPAVVEAESAAAESVAAEGDHAIDFSLDMGEDAAAATSLVPEISAPEVLASPSASDIDFDLDLGSDLPVADEGTGQAASLPSGGMSDALGLADISLDLGEAEVVTPLAVNVSPDELKLPELEVPAVEVKSDSGMDLDLALDDGGAVSAVSSIGADTQTGPELKMPEVEEVAPSVDFSVDLPDIELDSAAVPMPAVDGGDADDPEVATKLELAQAYEEMGDREGARELLNEVLSEGSAAQQAAARSRLDQLAV